MGGGGIGLYEDMQPQQERVLKPGREPRGLLATSPM